MKVAHESPLAVFDLVQQHTDYCYFLVHLFEESPAYFEKAQQAVAKGRHVILDNSNFELGKPFDGTRYQYWINELKPTEYVIPDALEDSYETIRKLEEWNEFFRPDTYGKAIGVVQGRSYDDLVWCYRKIEPLIDKVAISFDYSFFRGESLLDKMRSRQWLIRSLLDEEVINTSKPHHLLGTYLPQEFGYYKDMNWIETIDTSNPVVNGYSGIKYTDKGLTKKPETKLFTLINEPVNEKQREDILFNIKKFREINGI